MPNIPIVIQAHELEDFVLNIDIGKSRTIRVTDRTGETKRFQIKRVS